jgi:hypothetical protein
MKYNNIKTKKGKAKPNPTKKGFEEDRATSIVRHVTKPCLLTIQHWLKLNKSPNSSVGRALGCFPNGPGFESLFGQRDLFPAEKKGRFRCRQRVFFRNRFFPIGKNPFFSFRKKPDKFKSVYRVFFPFLKKTRTTLYYLLVDCKILFDKKTTLKLTSKSKNCICFVLGAHLCH